MFRSLGWLALPLACLYAAILLLDHGHFTYTLDDPYIHLALARNIAVGHYGINASEFSAPSSSPLWPFLLAPFSRLPLALYEQVPLLINFACAMGTLWLIRRLFLSQGQGIATLLAAVMGLVFNVYGLPFNGLEHALQVFLVVTIAIGVIESERTGTQAHPLTWSFWLAMMALPLVRYEGLAVVLPVGLYLMWRGEFRSALFTGMAAALLLLAFSVYLSHLGLGYLPSSIVAKSQGFDVRGVTGNLRHNLHEHGWVPLLVLGCAAYMPGLGKARSAVLLAVCGLHLLFGHFGAYGRYEVYFLVFVALMLLDVALQQWPRFWRFVTALPIAVSPMLYATLTTPLAALNVYSQQVQMADIVKSMGMKVAVNDLGLVSLRGGQYVLDLWGLGSFEALAQHKANPDGGDWMADMMDRKGVEIAMVYDTWFPVRPARWIKVGQLQMKMTNITLGAPDVSIYATNPAAAERLAAVLSRAAWQSHTGGRFAIEHTRVASQLAAHTEPRANSVEP